MSDVDRHRRRDLHRPAVNALGAGQQIERVRALAEVVVGSTVVPS
jgi:hypothetical protein